MTKRIIRTKRDLDMLAKFLGQKKLPITVDVQDGRARTAEQNRLNRLWCNEIAEQFGDSTPEEVRGYLKLAYGVPILRAENEDFCAKYDETIKPLPYETKLALMQEPFDFGVTRLMTVSQQVRYLDAVHRFYTEKGVVLTDPDPEMAAEMQKRRVVA